MRIRRRRVLRTWRTSGWYDVAGVRGDAVGEVLQRDQLQRCSGANRRFLCAVVRAMRLWTHRSINESIVEVHVPHYREETVEVMNRGHSHNVPVPPRQEQFLEVLVSAGQGSTASC